MQGIRWWPPPSFDPERGFSRRKQYRAVTPRYDKLQLRWQANNDIIETIDWIRATPDTTQP
jgi:hypothetical protein